MCSQLRIYLFAWMNNDTRNSVSANCTVLNNIISTITRLETDTDSYESKYKKCSICYEQINKDITQLQEQNKQLSQIQQMLMELKQNICANEKSSFINEVQEILFVPLRQPNKRTQSSVHLSLPALESVQAYFQFLAQQPLVDAYFEVEISAETEQKKHTQQVQKLQQKLKSLDQEVTEVLGKLKNTRRVI